jgi:hypothetical protein
VGDHDATLAGTINPGNAVSSWWFEYGDTTAYGQSTAAQTESADPNPIAVQTAVSGIDSGTAYHYRVVMRTGDWTIRGADQTVTTTGQAPPPPPDTQITLAPPQRTANNTAEIRFVATPATGAGFECRLDTATWSACTSPFVTTAGEGAHTFAVRATNGKPDLSPATTIWTVDTTPPDTFLAGTPAASTTDASAAFSFRSNEAPVTFECRLDGGPWSGCTSPNTVSGLSPGSHRFEVRATDAVGWVDQTPAASGWVVDSAAGSIPSSPFPDATSGVAGSPITTGPGAALLPVARVAVSGPVRLDRRRASVSLTLVCRGPGPCAGRLSVLLRGLNVAGTSFRIAAGARKSVTLKLGRQGRRVLRLRPPRTASLALTRAARTALERSATRLLTN